MRLELAERAGARQGALTSRRELLLAGTAIALGAPAAAQQRVDFSAELPAHSQSPASASASGASPADQPLLEQIDASALGRIPGATGAPSPADFWRAPRFIWLHRPATGRALKTVWWAEGRVIPQAYEAASLFLGDPRMERRIREAIRTSGAVPVGWHHAVWASPVVLDVLYAMTAWLMYFGISRPIHVTSAFRHPLTNAAIEGAARDSLHQRGAAVDVVIPGVSAAKVAEFGAWMRAGGVGVYPERGFTHLDAGRVRSWRGR